jgi:ABC-type antimicrobial peptide transport system permease subunit
VAITTAALGISNTMMMAVSERRREIGVLRSLGAEERDIRALFLVESGLVGLVGSAMGVVLGYGVARAASLVAREAMRRQDVTRIDIFATPVWLVLVALLFGTAVAVAAGALPAARAARLEPVRALRDE